MSVEQLTRFSASSYNDGTHKHLWIKGAELYIPQLIGFLSKAGYAPLIRNMAEFDSSASAELSRILTRNHSDKATTHNYHILYSYILDKLGRGNALNILEVGMGTNNPTIVSSMGAGGRPGASLYSWKEYLPNSTIYGADIDKDILFNVDRINTHFVDQLDMHTFNEMQAAFNVKYDMIIDDGLHSIGANQNTLLFALDHVKDNGWIVIEDIDVSRLDNWYAVDFILRQNSELECFFVRGQVHSMYCVHKKSSL